MYSNSTKQRSKNNTESHNKYSEDKCSEAQRGGAERSTQHGAAINTAKKNKYYSKNRSEEDNEQGSAAKRKMALALLIKIWGGRIPPDPPLCKRGSVAVLGSLRRALSACLGLSWNCQELSWASLRLS